MHQTPVSTGDRQATGLAAGGKQDDIGVKGPTVREYQLAGCCLKVVNPDSKIGGYIERLAFVCVQELGRRKIETFREKHLLGQGRALVAPVWIPVDKGNSPPIAFLPQDPCGRRTRGTCAHDRHVCNVSHD